MSIKKYVMIVIKSAIGATPKQVRNFFKKSPVLTSFYSRSLQKSGLFYGFPSNIKLQTLYTNRLKLQSVEINQVIKSDNVVNEKFDVVIFSKDEGSLVNTFESLGGQPELLNTVYILSCRNKTQLPTQFTFDIELITNLSVLKHKESNFPLLAINLGDRVHHSALAVLARKPLEGMLYTDTDELNADLKLENARLLPGWNPDLQLSTGYIESGVVLHPTLLEEVDIANVEDIASLVVLLFKRFKNLSVTHIPLSLVHYSDNKKFKLLTLKNVLKQTSELEVKTTFSKTFLVNHIIWPLQSEPLISLIIPTKNAKELVQTCIESILTKTAYRNFEILLVDNNSDELEALEYFEHLNHCEKHVRVLKYPYEFNYSAINNFAVNHAQGEIIGLVNNDIEVISPNWMGDMAGHAMRPDIGCVGAKLLYPDERVQHAGVVMGYGGGAGHAHKYFPRYHPGYLNRLVATNNFSAVTAACLFVTKKDFNQVNGLDEDNLKVAFNDVDFCLKVLELGRRNVYCAEAELFHHESVSRGLDNTKEKRKRFEKELKYIQEKWGHFIKNDPAYNSNLTLRHENFSIRE